MRLLACLLACLLLCPVARAAEEFRKWTSTKGTTFEARMVSADDEQVVLVGKKDGKELKVSLAKLSAEDRRYVAAAGAAAASPATASPAAAVEFEEPTGESFTGTFEAAGAKFFVEPPLIRVSTERFDADIVDMCVSQVKDKKTGRSFCRAGKNTAGGRAFLELQDFRPGRGTRTFTHVPGDQAGQAPAVIEEWVVLKPQGFTSAVGGTTKIEADGAVLISGKNGKDTYTFKTVVPPGVEPKAIRLEALPDVGLPGHGPGRSTNGTFVVTEFAVAAGPDAKRVTLTAPVADTQEPNFPVAGAIDDKPDTGWSTGGEGGRPHQATFTIDPAAKLAAGTPLTITIKQLHSDEHTIGKVRLAVMHQPKGAALAMASGPRTHVRKLPRGVEYTVTGLVSEQADKQYYRDAMVGLRIEHDQKTGDLLLTPLAKAGRPEQFGAYDEGIRSATFTMGPFRSEVRMIMPDGGQGPVRDFWATWPLNMPANLIVFEGENSCLGLWADDEKLEFGKIYGCGAGTLRVVTVSGDAPWMTGRLVAPIWRLNVFESWEGAGLRYTETMERTLGVVPLPKREPAWARNIRFVAHQVFGLQNLQNYYLNKGVPKEAIMEWDTQGWLNGYATEIMSPKRPEWFPNFPFDHATHYEGHPNYLQSVKERQDFGIPCFPYTCMYVHMSEPFKKDSRVLRAPDKDFQCGGRMWWVLYTDMCKDIVEKYGVRGIYDDCSWIGPEYDPRGRVDGLTVWQAHAWGRRHMRDSLLPVAFMGERQHEFTTISDMIALMWIGGEVHPINNFLFGRYTLRWNQAEEIQQGNFIGRGYCDTFEVHNSLDASESLGCISMHSTGRYVDVGPVLQEPKFINKRMYFIPREMLTSYFPDRYEPDVIGYLRGKDGTEYRTKSKGGIGLVRLTKDKKEQVVWWRSKQVAEAHLPGAAIEGWVAYDGDKAIGLNPAQRYCALEDGKRPPAVIKSLPKEAHLTLSKIDDGYWVAAVGGQNLPPAVELAVAAPAGTKVSFLGAESVSGPDGSGVYKVKVAPGRWLTAAWNHEAVKASAPMELPIPKQLTFVDHDTGLPKSIGGPKGKELWFDFSWLLKASRQVDWLLKVPAGGGKFAATIIDTGKATADVRVRVDGEVVAQVKHAPGQKTPVQVPLQKFAGKTVLVSLDIDVGDGSGMGVSGVSLAAP